MSMYPQRSTIGNRLAQVALHPQCGVEQGMHEVYMSVNECMHAGEKTQV